MCGTKRKPEGGCSDLMQVIGHGALRGGPRVSAAVQEKQRTLGASHVGSVSVKRPRQGAGGERQLNPCGKSLREGKRAKGAVQATEWRSHGVVAHVRYSSAAVNEG